MGLGCHELSLRSDVARRTQASGVHVHSHTHTHTIHVHTSVRAHRPTRTHSQVVECCDWNRVTMVDMMRKISSADIVYGLHGAGLANAL